MLVPMKDLLIKAQQGGYAVPAFSNYNQATTEAIVEEAEALRSPVIVMVSGVYIKALTLPVVSLMVREAAARVSVPVGLHLDHGESYDLAADCVRAGFTSVMFDGSHFPYDENVAISQKVVDLAHRKGVSTEAELGAVGGVEDAVFDDSRPSHLVLIDPSQAAAFVKATGVDCLAPAIGNVHGLTKQEPRLDLDLLRAVRRAVDVPLVLHGGSGISEETIREIIRIGVSKVNVGSELKAAWARGLKTYLDSGKYEPRLGVAAAKESIREVVRRKIRLFGAEGRARE